MPVSTSAAGARVAVVLKGWPRLSETFIAQEIAGLEARGVALEIWSLRRPTDKVHHPVHDRVAARTVYLPEYLKDDPRRVLAGWRKARRLPGYALARRKFLADLRRDPTANRVRRWGQALVLAAELPASIDRLYAHFLHTPASVTRYAAALRGLPWSVSAHAKDIWTSAPWEVAEKLEDAVWLVTCTGVGLQRLKELAPHPERLRLVYHGLDVAHLPPPPPPRLRRDGSDAADPVVILSIGRKVEKKGYGDLLQALAKLPRDLHWRFEHIGAGELSEVLKAEAVSLGIAQHCTWHGAQPQKAVFAALARADLFVLASKRAADGDQDGLPNVLMEAAHQGLPLVSTHAAAIGEFIVDGENGLLVSPGAPGELGAALARMIGDPDLRRRLAQRAGEVVRTRFSFDAGIDWIATALGERSMGQQRSSTARAAE
ncbi:glycosyltransferase family 4 protein [Reyranella sp.]|uniref:glycosyltransferase family 4 protein n=1 Tax=Reyranella sp. TaxID=1929291 RepID=UPI0027309786|nr:glycosyltransferase family 4 protein [Reyranella sp.]MDP2376879.1 glycosyltransferase family 4 protein [Reyranella sp.]